MPRRAGILPFAAVLLAFGVSPPPALADPILPCSSDSRSLARYAPCLHEGAFQLTNITAAVGGVDVSTSDFLGITTVVDNYPPDAKWLLFNVPVSGSLGHEVSSSTPLEVRYTMTAVGDARIRSLDMALLNAAFAGYSAGVEFSFAFDDGTMSAYLFGREGEPGRLIEEVPGDVRSMDVRIRLFGGADQGGAGVGLLVGNGGQGPAPVPEPATITLLGSGLALFLARRRHAKHG